MWEPDGRLRGTPEMTDMAALTHQAAGITTSDVVAVPAGPAIGIIEQRYGLLASQETVSLDHSICRTGDLATCDEQGYLWYQGRADDVFKAAGYRIGPSEIENCLVKHPAVVNAAVVPKPDAERGALVKAYVVLAPQVQQQRAIATRDPRAFDAELVAELQLHVRGKLAPYEYPKEIEFIEALPMTTTGKVQRRVLRLREEERARGGGAA